MADKGGYIGRNPGDAQVTIARQQFTPTGVTTDFTFTSGYSAGYLDVYINGSKILVGRDYTATNGSTVGLTSAAQNGDIIELVAYKAFNVNNVSASSGNFDVGGILTVDDNTTLSGQLEVTGVSTFAGAVENVVSTGIITATTFSGNITGTAATFTGNSTFSGNVSIGGTLTYEDVTNIDSVGVVTARIGLKVLAGGINAVGVVTATSFKGDGSALTGVSAGLTTDVYFNTSGGIAALDSMTSGQALDNTAVGFNALTADTTGDQNTGIGASALAATTTGGYNTGIGYRALTANTTGGGNVAIGVDSLLANTTASDNVAVGRAALTVNTTGAQNTALGRSSLKSNITSFKGRL